MPYTIEIVYTQIEEVAFDADNQFDLLETVETYIDNNKPPSALMLIGTLSNNHFMNKEDFLNPKAAYKGDPYSLETLAFNANLQEFTSKVSYIVGLETNGKITPQEAYKQIKKMWKGLKTSKKNLIDTQEDNEPH